MQPEGRGRSFITTRDESMHLPVLWSTRSMKVYQDIGHQMELERKSEFESGSRPGHLLAAVTPAPVAGFALPVGPSMQTGMTLVTTLIANLRQARPTAVGSSSGSCPTSEVKGAARGPRFITSRDGLMRMPMLGSAGSLTAQGNWKFLRRTERRSFLCCCQAWTWACTSWIPGLQSGNNSPCSACHFTSGSAIHADGHDACKEIGCELEEVEGRKRWQGCHRANFGKYRRQCLINEHAAGTGAVCWWNILDIQEMMTS